jgi:hypothetical protein
MIKQVKKAITFSAMVAEPGRLESEDDLADILITLPAIAQYDVTGLYGTNELKVMISIVNDKHYIY